MKVLFVSSWYPSGANPLKGIFVKQHAAAIKSAGVDIRVVALTVNPSDKLYEKKEYELVDEHGVITYFIELNSKYYKLIYLSLFFQFRLLKKVYGRVRTDFEPDIIHSNVLFPAGILGYWLSKKEKKKHVITEHWSKVPKFMKKSLWAFAGRAAYDHAAAITAVSSFLAKRISPFMKQSNKISIVPNVVDVETFAYRPKSAKPGRVQFCCVAHWSPPKRPDLIFEALAHYAASAKEKVTLNVVGEGYLLDELKKRQWPFLLNCRGNLWRPELAEVLKESDYFLHASDIETFSIVIAEALATGTPVLASNTGAIPELISEESGLLCGNTAEEWKLSLTKLCAIKNWKHSEISRGAEKFSLKQSGKLFVRVYEKLL